MKSLLNPLMGASLLAVAALIGPIVPCAFAGQAAVPSAQHNHAQPGTKHSMVEYTLPEVKLVRDDGKTVALADELNDGRPVILNFIYTTCTTFCPVASHTFSKLQAKLGADQDKVHMVSISIDPEQDTPAHLKEYARKFKAGPQWRHYTGTMEASRAVQQAFDVYRGDKMNHPAVTLLRAAPGKAWLRIDGFATADDLLREYRGLVASK